MDEAFWTWSKFHTSEEVEIEKEREKGEKETIKKKRDRQRDIERKGNKEKRQAEIYCVDRIL